MIATHAHCGSPICKHKEPHAKNDFCGDGQCRWSTECRCVPESKKERLVALIHDYHTAFVPMTDEEFADRIEEIYEEGKDADL